MDGSYLGSDLFKKGLAVRRDVLGSAYVDASIAGANGFLAPLQKLVTEWCWGEIWTRPGLDRKARSMINLAMLTALNRPEEVKLHVRGALNNGVTPDEISEILLQAAVYCGVPAALDSFRIAARIIEEHERTGKNGEAKDGTGE